MKIEKAAAVAFLLELGFKAAEDYDNEKLATRLAEVPSRLTSEAIPSKMQGLYEDLAAAVKEGKTISVVEDTTDSKPATKSKKGASKPAAKGTKPAGKGKPAAKEKTPKVKKEKAPRKAREVDSLGATVGSNRAKINAVLTAKLQTDEEIAKAAGVDLRKARLHCRRLARKGLMEKVRTIAYRLVPAKEAAKAKA